MPPTPPRYHPTMADLSKFVGCWYKVKLMYASKEITRYVKPVRAYYKHGVPSRLTYFSVVEIMKATATGVIETCYKYDTEWLARDVLLVIDSELTDESEIAMLELALL